MFGRLSFLALVFVVLLTACSRPIARFSYSGEQVAPARISFENLSENAEEFEWDLGDGTIVSDTNIVHEYRSSGNYLISLKAKKGNKEKTVQQRIVIDAPLTCLVELETEFGNMLIELFDATPQHRDNFSKLVEEGFYDGLLFHRVIDGFMIQGGDPNSRNSGSDQPLGAGGPGYTIPAEFVDTLVHIKGVLAAARIGDSANPKKNSSGSQFYIVQGGPVSGERLDRMEARKGKRYSKALREAYLEKGGTPQLDWDYTVFGRVIEGMEVIDKIATVPTDERDLPREDVKMKMRLIK